MVDWYRFLGGVANSGSFLPPFNFYSQRAVVFVWRTSCHFNGTLPKKKGHDAGATSRAQLGE